jgi:hypothetical protein
MSRLISPSEQIGFLASRAFERLAGDINYDCKVDLLDLANLAASWLQENYSTE